MLDIKLLRENKELIIDNLKKRDGFDTSIVDIVLEKDEQWRKKKKEVDLLKATKNSESKKISSLKKDGKDIKNQILKIKEISNELEELEIQVKELEEERNIQLSKIPNLLDEDVPKGLDDEENVTVKTHGEKPNFSFDVKNHQQLCELNDWYELEKAAEHSGARFYYLKNELVLLEIALYNYTLQKLANKGYQPIEVPPMLRRNTLAKSVALEDFEEVIYKIEDEDLYLIGTSEHSLAALHTNEVLNHKKLPIKYAGISPCFRKEAGVTKDSKGIFRVHNFNKIEQFIFSKPQDSEKYLEELVKNAEEIYQELELHYRVVNICTGDIGNFAAKKYDIEAWLPGQNNYREMVSASNYRDYGARRLNCRFQDEKNNLNFVHTLNSTAIALTRTIIAIIETHQTKDGNVKVPKVLKPYIGRDFLLNK